MNSNVPARPKRSVELLVSSDRLTPSELTDLLGVRPDETMSKGTTIEGRYRTRIADAHTWSLTEAGDDLSYLTGMIEHVLSRLGDATARLRHLVERGDCMVALLVVEYLSDTDRTGHGIHLEVHTIQTLASLQADADIAQYVWCEGQADEPHGSDRA